MQILIASKPKSTPLWSLGLNSCKSWAFELKFAVRFVACLLIHFVVKCITLSAYQRRSSRPGIVRNIHAS